jgi:glycosyltransferase involved in cell wall biosynthesis
VRTTVIFDNFGPYHLARLRAAASVTELLAVEVAASSAEYAWKREAQDGGQKPDAGGRRTEVSGQQGTSNIEHPTSNIQTAESAECGAQSGEPEDGGRRTEGRRQKTEDGAESRKQKIENKKEFQLSAFSVSAFKNVTLLEAGTSRDVSHRELAARLNRALDDFRPQVVFIPGWSSKAAFAALRWCVRHNIPAVAMSESTEWDEARSAWREAVKQRIVGLCSAALVGGSPHKDYLVQLGMPAERVFFGYDAVDNGYFADKVAEVRSQKSEVRRKHGLPENYFLASARFIEKKNLPRLLKAYARYRELAEKTESGKQPGEVASQRLHGPGKVENQNEFQPGSAPAPGATFDASSKDSGFAPFQLSEFQLSAFNPWPLVLLGDGALRSDLCRLISDLSLQDSVLLPGFKQYPDLPAYYGLANAFIHASTTEQWGLVVNEAMASGLPVLVSNRCGCAADLVQEGGNGFTFDPDNVEQLAQLMLKISALPSPPRSGRGQGEVSSSNSDPASNISHQSSSLAQMGDASRQIIANWGPERFAQGLQAAAEKAMAVGPKHASWFDRLLLQGLFSR